MITHTVCILLNTCSTTSSPPGYRHLLTRTLHASVPYKTLWTLATEMLSGFHGQTCLLQLLKLQDSCDHKSLCPMRSVSRWIFFVTCPARSLYVSCCICTLSRCTCSGTSSNGVTTNSSHMATSPSVHVSCLPFSPLVSSKICQTRLTITSAHSYWGTMTWYVDLCTVSLLSLVKALKLSLTCLPLSNHAGLCPH